jgi:hypothetical protein
MKSHQAAQAAYPEDLFIVAFFWSDLQTPSP